MHHRVPRLPRLATRPLLFQSIKPLPVTSVVVCSQEAGYARTPARTGCVWVSFILCSWCSGLRSSAVTCLSGRKSSPRKRVWCKPPWVQIPPSPPQSPRRSGGSPRFRAIARPRAGALASVALQQGEQRVNSVHETPPAAQGPNGGDGTGTRSGVSCTGQLHRIGGESGGRSGGCAVGLPAFTARANEGV